MVYVHINKAQFNHGEASSLKCCVRHRWLCCLHAPVFRFAYNFHLTFLRDIVPICWISSLRASGSQFWENSLKG